MLFKNSLTVGKTVITHLVFSEFHEICCKVTLSHFGKNSKKLGKYLLESKLPTPIRFSGKNKYN